MKYFLWGFVLLPLVISPVLASTAKSKTESVVFGNNNAQVVNSTEATVNDKTVMVESDQPGNIELEMKDDQVRIKTSGGITPTIFISAKKITPTISLVSPTLSPIKSTPNLPSFLSRVRSLLKSLLDKLSWL